MTHLLSMSERDIKRHAIVQRYMHKDISRKHAAELLDITERHVSRLRQAVLKEGAKALMHKQRGQPSHHCLSAVERATIRRLLTERYADFGPTLACEKLRVVHQINHDPKTIRSIQIEMGLWKPRRKRTPMDHRSWRQRRVAYGEMEQFDGSYHDWFEGRGGISEACLLAAIDDATSQLTKAEFAEHEGVVPVFRFWKTYIEDYGKPCQIYLDRFSTYKMNSAVAKDQPDLKTQFGRAMETLEIEPIFAHSPQAKGRIERLFSTLQDRLVKELRLKKISTIKAANQFLKVEFIPAFNAQFSVEPRSSANLHRSLSARERTQLPSIFSRQEQRTVQHDYTIAFDNQWYQLMAKQSVRVVPKDVVTVEQHLDATIHLRLRGKELSYLCLPARPPKVQPLRPMPCTVPRKPPLSHPWRQRIAADVRLASQQLNTGHSNFPT